MEGAGYIPPHARLADKLPAFLSDDSNENTSAINVTVHRSNVASIPRADGKSNQETDDSQPHPAIMAMFESINDKMSEQISRLKRMDLAAVNTNKSLQFTQDNVTDLQTRVQALENENKNLAKQNEECQRHTRDMGRGLDLIEQKLEQNDHTQRLRNILIEGVAESQGENVFDIAIDILTAILPQMGTGNLEFAQRVNKPGGKRPILVVFKTISLRDAILANKRKLKEKTNMKSIWLNEDANPVIKKQKNDARPVVREAQKQGVQAKQRGTGLVLDNVYYPHNKLNDLPENIKLAQTRTRISDSKVGFAGHLAPLSNMHRAPYTKDGQPYLTVEQGHGHSKAKYAKDQKAAQQILDTDCAYTAHNIARAIHAPGWDAIALPDLREHMKEKYQQNDNCMQALLNTGTKRLLELTWDRTWAAGYGLNSKLFHTDIQPGQNQTGYTLEELRTEFRGAVALGEQVKDVNTASVSPRNDTSPCPTADIGANAQYRTPPKLPIALGQLHTTSPVTNV